MEVINTDATVDQVALAAFTLQIAADPRAEEVSWSHCLKAADVAGLGLDEDAGEELEAAVERLWQDHMASPRPLGERRSYRADGSDGVPGWFAITDHRGHYLRLQYERRADADIYCYWNTRQLEEGVGSYCPALIQDDLSTTCDI